MNGEAALAHLLAVSGPRACFARPEFRNDYVTYDVMTPIAARGIFEAVHWTPAIRWRVETIEILHPIRSRWSPDSPEMGRKGAASTSRSLMLIDVDYIIQARFDLTDAAGPQDNAGQHSAMFKRRARSGRFFRQPYLGRRECPASVSLIDPETRPPSCHGGTGDVDLGWMIYDHQFDALGRMRHFRPVMRNGVIDLTGIDPATLPS